MKKKIFFFLLIVGTLFVVENTLQAGPKKDLVAVVVKSNKVDEDLLLARLYEIQGMDKSKLSASERKVLRKEVKSLKSKMSEMKGGVYLSVGAIVIIVLLLILIL
jgi:hypothetical protein